MRKGMKLSKKKTLALTLLFMALVIPHALSQAPPPIRGFADIHTHQFSYLAFGGKAVAGKAFGPIDQALPHCNYAHGFQGTLDLYGIFSGGPLNHPNGGYPEFDGWPFWRTRTHQTMYEDWLLRAYQGGLRLIVVFAVNNEFLCNRQGPASGRTCADREAIQYQIDEAYAMQSYIDSRSGGPGRGWYRIVTSPQEARNVIAQGKLAVVLGAEVDALLDCGFGNPPCTEDYVRREIASLYDRGLRHIFPIHFNTNQFGGAAISNPLSTVRERYFGDCLYVRNCSAEGYRSRPSPDRYAFCSIGAGICNREGLTDLGKFFVREMIRKRMIIDTDHMAEWAFDDTLDVADTYVLGSYPMVAGHVALLDTVDPANWNEQGRTRSQIDRIKRTGGMIGLALTQGHITGVPGPCDLTSESFARVYRYAVTQGIPMGFGTDFNGNADGQMSPRFGPSPCHGASMAGRLPYPFTALATGVRLDKSEVGNRTIASGTAFDFNVDGVAHVGMLPDLIADLQNQIGAEALNPLLNSAETYIRMWERITRGVHINFFVDGAAASSGEGTFQRPYKTVAEAVNAALDGDSIFIKPGSYPENLTITKSVTLGKWGGAPGTADIGR